MNGAVNGGERTRRRVVEPLSLVFAYVARDRGGSFRRGDIVATGVASERAAAELERRYPEGVDGLRAGYVLLRRGLLCMGVPRECGEGAVAWTGYIPRRLRLRRRAVVLRQFADSIGYACLRRGVPVALGGRVVREGEERAPDLGPEHGDDIFARMPAEFAAAPRYHLLPRGTRPVVAAGMHPIRERRRPSLAPVLSGVRRPRRRLRAPAAANLLVALVLVTVAVTSSGGQTAGAEPGAAPTAQAGVRAPGVRAAGTGGARTTASPAEDAAVALEALGRSLEPLSPRLRLREIRADGTALRVRATGGDAESVREVLDADADFENVVMVSRRESGFVIEARYRGRGYPARRHRGRLEPITRPRDSGGVRAAALLEDAGAEGVAFERVDTAVAGVDAAGSGGEIHYRLRAEASADATAEALVALTAPQLEISVTALSLTRAGRARWRMTAVVTNREVAEE
jgi:hypothetical protein